MDVKEDMGFDSESERTIKISISEHDVRECKTQFQRMAMAILITTFLHYKWGKNKMDKVNEADSDCDQQGSFHR